MKHRPIIPAVCLVLTVAVAVAETPPPQIREEPPSWRALALGDGEQLYGELCAVCHGTGAKGDGPAAPALRAVTPDLTLLAFNNDGVFPFEEVRRAIVGEGEIIAHGTRQMPIWGDAFAELRPDQKPARRQAFAKLRIRHLTLYLESLQE